MEILKKLFNTPASSQSVYWKVNDKQWMQARKKLWQELEACLIEKRVFDKKELKAAESYFLTGKRKQDSEKREIVSFMFSLAWHPSTAVEAWLAEFERIKEQAYDDYRMVNSVCEGYIKLRDYDKWYKLKSATTAVPNLYLGREGLLYQFFFKNKDFLNHPLIAETSECREEALFHIKNRTLSYPSLHLMEEKEYTRTFATYFLDDLKPFLTTDFYNKQFKNQNTTERLSNAFNDSAEIVNNIDRYEAEFKEKVLQWQAIMESKDIVPEWQQFWLDAKAGALKPKEVDAIAPEEEATVTETTNLPIVSELKALGYECSQTDDITDLLLDIFEDASVELFDIEDEGILPPYEGVLAPLQLLIDQNQQGDKIKYSDGNELKVTLNNKKFGKINLQDPLEESTEDYFRSVIELAKSWFPEQFYLSVDEGMIVLFILPKEVKFLLESYGYKTAQDFSSANS